MRESRSDLEPPTPFRPLGDAAGVDPETGDRWRRSQAIFQRALELDTEARGEFLDRSCDDDPETRRRVERLLRAHRSPLAWLEGSVFDAVPDLLEIGPEAPVTGRRIGPYAIERELGRGGMGVVYLARRADSQFEQRVALKLIRGDLPAELEERRLRQERQILASLEHPNIARLLGGDVTAEGLPYLVMEYVEGEPLEAWCRRLEPDLETRLDLVRQICDAVGYAHRHLVVHCDLKPSNVLVTADGVPKLLDFGIARLLGDDFVPRLAATTLGGRWRMTPEFASPEQVRGERLTAASDLYSLGVMLYRLLTGGTPYRLEDLTLHELQVVVGEQVPAPPSLALGQGADPERSGDLPKPPLDATRRRLSGDLDNIVAMALRKDPARRYASAQQLAEDLRRHSTGLPVSARPDTLLYRTGKFARRHRLALTAAVLVAASLLGGLWAALAERARAEHSRAQAEAVASFLTGLFQDADSAGEISAGALLGEPGARAARQLLLDEGARRVGVELAGQGALQAELRQRIGDAYRNLGALDKAERELEAALELRRWSFGESSPQVASSLDSLCVLRLAQGRHGEAETLCRRGLEARRSSPRVDPLLVATSLNSLALVLRAEERFDDAEELVRQGLELRRRHLPERHRAVTSLLNNLAVLKQQQGDLDAAEALLRQVLERKRGRHGEEHLQVVNSRNNLASLLQDVGRKTRDGARLDEAEALYRRALDSGRALSGGVHPLVATVGFNLGTLLAERGHLEEAAEHLGEALDLDRQLFGDTHPDVARDLKSLAVVAYRQGRLEEAAVSLRQAHEIYRQTLGPRHPRTRSVLSSLVNLHAAGGDEDAAARYRRQLAGETRSPEARDLGADPASGGGAHR